jgi:hypothetical protein
MKNQPQESKYKLKRSVCMGLALFLFVVIGAGCATPTPPPQEQGQYIKVQVGQNSVSVPWSNTQNPSQAYTQLTMQQIVDWTKQGVSSDEIISRIKSANPKYSLTADDISYLKRQGVSQRVIETMQAYR